MTLCYETLKETFSVKQLSQEQDGVQSSTSSCSPWGNATWHGSLSVPRTFLLHSWESIVLSDKYWAEPYVNLVALCNMGGWVSIYCSTYENFPLWPDLKRQDWITSHFFSDWHWMLKTCSQCRQISFLLMEFLYSLKFLDQHKPASANSSFTSNY